MVLGDREGEALGRKKSRWSRAKEGLGLQYLLSTEDLYTSVKVLRGSALFFRESLMMFRSTDFAASSSRLR